uniref:Dystonin n=1 Tax=Oncorhynchus tshawytscha TaxID=74940 RepID=A0AAZ3PN52_ONCTS
MIAAAFLVLLRPYSIQVVLLLLLLLLGTIATILFFCCWHRRLRNGKHPIKSVLSGRSRSRAGLRTHHFRSEGFRHSPRHARRARARVAEEKPLVEIPQSDHQSDSSTTVRKRKVKKRVLPDFYHSVQVTPTRKPSSGSGNASLHCSMSSSADFSDEDDYSLKSGSVSPAPGDTLPWNLPRHERHKRQIQGGSVLDPAERAVLRIADERDRVQKKTFTKWINQHLLKVRKHVNDLYEDLRDGHNLISLLEVLTGQSLPREKGRMRFHRLQNVQIALDFLKRRQVKLVNIRNDDITDGNPKLTLGLIWTIILHFQISEIHVCGESEDMTAKERLLMWSQQMTEGYVGVRCDNFTSSWRDGRLFNAIIHKYRPDLVDMARVSAQTSRSNLEQAFGVAERLGVARLLDPEDVDVQTPDEKSVITYVSTLYDVFPKVPDGVDGINANDVDIKWVEYQNMVNYLSQWLKHNVAVMSDRAFPNNPVELKALYTQYLQFKENEIPLKETEKSKIKHLYKMLEVWIEFGRIQLPQGYHPNDVEKEWGKLIVAMLEREKSLRPEVDRLEMLQQIASRVQRDCVNGEDKLELARAALQSDAKRLESGVQFQNEAETAGYLLECENLLRQQVVDIQILLDGKYYYSDQLVQRVSKLRDDLLGLRAECSSVYRQGRFSSSNLNSSLTPGGLGTPGSTFTSILTPGLTPALSPAMTPADPNMTEDEVNINFVQDLINWVEEMQVQLDRGDWGSDLPSVETHLENHKGVHRAIEEFQMSLKEAKLSETQMNQKLSYSEKLGKLETQYGKLLNCSRERQKNLESLHDFVSRATMELIWLNEKEEEEVAFDWSDLNGNISKKRQYHSDLMRELDEKEEVIKSVQDRAENLLQENHPARLTLEAYKAAMQTQWSWILQLCSCVEQHLKDNTVYFESTDYLKSLQGDIQRKYGCDRTSSVHKLEDHIQESMDEKEQLLQYRSTVAGLVGKAKAIVQLKPRNPDTPVRSSIPVKAICDYRQIEITIYKDDECVLASNSHRAKWKVISPSGNEAMVPSVCFTVPPPNKEAVDQASRIEQLYQNVLALWHHSHIKMKSVVSWHYLMADVRAVRDWNIKTMLPGEHQQVLSNLQSHFEDFLEDSKESEVFTVADCSQLEREVLACKDYYEELLKSAERGKNKQSYDLTSPTPLQKKKAELDQLKDDLETMKEKCETFFRQAGASPAVPTLSSDLNVLIHSMSQRAQTLLWSSSQWRSEIDEQREIFHDLEDGLQKARGISERMFKAHNERDFDLDWHKEKADQLEERWSNVHSQIESRLVLRDLEGISKSLKYYKDSYGSLDEWVREMEAAQLKTQEKQPEDSKALAELVNQQKLLVAEMEQKQSRIDECQKYSEQYSSGAKDYELQLLTYRAMVDSQHKSPLKRRRMQNSADAIIQEFMDLRTRYTAVVTSMTQYVKFASETLKRAEGEEKLEDHLKRKSSDVQDLEEHNRTLQRMQHSSVTHSIQTIHAEVEAEVLQQKQELAMAKKTAETEIKTLKSELNSVLVHKKIAEEKAQQFTELLDDANTRLKKLQLDMESDKSTMRQKSEEFRQESLELRNSIYQTIEGVLEVGSIEVYSVFSSVQSGMIDHTTGLSLLEAQLITSGLVLPQFRMCLELDEAFHHNLIDEATWKQLRELNEANRSILSPPFSSEPLPVMAALREGAVSERLAMKVIEIQLATGGLRVSYTGDVLTLERAFQFGLIPAPLYVKLLERQNTWKDLINPGTAEKVSLTQLVQRSVVDEETGLRLLPVKKSHNGSIELTSGREMSVLRAVHEGLIDRETTLRLLGAQLFAGGIADPKTGRKLTVEQALSEGLIDQDTASGILSQQAQNGGIVNPQNGKRLTVDEAVQCDLMSFSSALLVLEKQKGLMGLLWPHSGEILTVSTSLRHEIITSQLAFKLLSNRQKIASLYIPEYSEVVDINSATQNGLIDVHTAEVLKTIEIPDVFPDVDDLNDRFSNWLMLRELQIGGSHRSTDDNEIDYENINTPSSIEAKQLFISYLTMNSYMDPKSGQRLLIFDGQLTKMAELLVDISVETTENQVYNTGPGNAPFEDISLKEDISEDSEMSFDSNTEDFGYLHINEETDGTMKDHHASNFFKEEESAYKQSDNQAFSNNVVKVVAHDGTEDFPSAIDCVNNTTLPDSDISIYQKNTSSIPIGIDVESSDNQSNETFTGSSATQTPSTDMSLPSGALDCKMMIAHDFTEKFHSSVKNTRQHNSVSSDGPSPFEIGLETSDKALYNQSIGESATHAMSESSTRTKSCSVSGKDISLLAQRVTDEASVAVHSEKNARQPDSKDNVLSNSTYQKTRHSTNPSSFEIGVETSEIPSDYQSQETVNGVSASETVLESSAPPRLCFVNDTDMRLTSGAKDSKKVVAKGLTEEASVEVSSCKNTRTSPALTEIDLVTSETYSDNQPKDTANGVSATQTILESSTPRFCTVDSKKTIQQSDSEAIVSKKKKINNTSIVPFEINVETSHITSDNQPQEAFTFNEGSATQIILERSTHPLLCSVNDADRSFPSAAPDSKRMPAQKEYSSSENNAQHSKMEVAHGFRDESPISIDSEKNTRQPSFEMGVLSDRIYQTNTMSTSPTPFKMDSETDIASDNQPKGTFNGSSATQTVLKSSTLCSRKDTGLPLASVAQGSPQRPTYPVTPGCETDKDTNFESSLLATVLTDTLDTTTAFPCTEEVVWDNTDERGLATHLLRPQVEEGGILYIISEKRCDLDSPFDKGLVDEETVLEVSALQLHKGDVLEEERSTVATLKEVVSESSISSQIALQTMEQHSMLGGVHDPKSGCTISVSAALDSAMIDDDLAEKILHSDPVHKAIIHPDRHCTHSMSYSQSLGLIDNDEAENLRQHQTDKKLSVLVLDDSDEEEWIENTDGHAREDLYTEGSKEQNCDSQKALLPSFTISHGPVCRQIISPILSDQVTEGRVIHELETTSSFREDSASHSPTSPLSDIVPGSRNSIQNDILSNRSNSLSLSDSGDSGAPQRQAEELRQTEEDGSSSLRRDTDLSCEAVGFTPGDGQLGAGYREIVGDQTVSPVQSDSGVSCSSHSDLLSDERKMENTVQAPASQLVKESDRRIDSSSPRDLSGDVTSTVSGDVGVSGDKTVINGDGVSSFNTVSPQRPLVKSERDVGGEIELTSSQNGHSHSKPTVQKKTPGMETNLSGTHRHLEDTAFDIQYFISEHAQFLSPTQSRHLLKSLSATQREFKEQMERVAKQRRTLERHLEIREDESQQKVWTQMTILQLGPLHLGKSGFQFALQKDILTNGSALNEVISSSKKFLDENRSKLTPDQIIAIESKLEDAKSKVKLINQRAEEARKDLEKSARHQEILSQQQELIMATQSAQALLDHQAHALSPTDKDKLQRDIQELKGRYDSSLTQAEQQMKQMVQVQEELKKFQGDCEEFEGWLQQAEGEVEELGAPAGALNDLTEKLRRQKSFSDDVISHKGDLRFITISGQKVLDVAKACGRMDPGGKDAQLEVDTTATCAAVKEKLDSAAGRFKALHSQVNSIPVLLLIIQELLFQSGMNFYQCQALTQNHCLLTLLLDDIVERYDNLSKSVSDRNEKLQITLTRSLSVQDGLDEMMSWMEGVEESVKEKGQVPLDSAVIGDALEQDISSRQSSISAMKAKVKKFVETADPAAAALLQSKMDALSQRFSDACDKHKHKQGQLEQLKDKVEEFEKTTEKVQQFVLKRSQALSETDGPGKNVNELSQLMQVAKEEVTSCQDQLGDFRAAAGALRTWLEETTEKVPVVQPTSSEQSLGKDLQRVNVSQGCAKFKLQGCFVLTDVCSSDTAWADVSGSVEDRKQRLEESNRNLDVFQTTEPQLRQWLSEKDMMLSVLGPLSMDPNMLNTQKQQVQILLNEFDSRKPQFDQLHEAAAAILSTSGKQDPSSGGKVVKDQLAAVTQKWQGLTGQLGQRAGLIDQAVGKSSQFQDLLMSLSQSAASLETRLNSQQALSSQPDVVKKQLEEANTISGQLREERKRLKEAETLCSELSALVTEDYLKAGLDRQLEGVNKPFKQLEDKAGWQLNSAFASSQQFHQASKDFQGWMNGKLQEQSKLQAISAQVETLRQSLKEQSALQKALSEHEEPYSTIVREGETLLQNTDGAEKVAMQGQLATLRSNWDDVKKSSAERQDKLQGALQRAQKYHEHAEKLQSWVQECEVREGSVRLSVDPAEVESSISQLKAIQKDVDKHRGLVEQLNTAADSLLEVANADTEAVREEKAAIGQSVDRVTDGVQNKRESLEKISQRLKEFNDTHNEAKGQLAGAKKQLDAHTSLGVQAYSNKNLTNMKAQQKSLDGVNTQVEHLKSLAQGLVADVPEADGVTDLLLQADSLEKEHGSLSKDVGETCSTLEGKLQGIGQFQTNIREMFTRFADLDDELDSMASVGRDLITLKEQQDGIKGFVEKLQGLMADTARGGDSCKKMLETEASPDLLGLKRDLDGLSKQCGKLMDRAKGRGEEVGSTLTRLDELYSKLQQFTNKLGGAEVKEEGQGSVGMETDVINQQLEAFKVRCQVDPLQSQLQDINWLGQGLIQNADKGTSTKGLEHDLEDVNTRWNTLNKKIAERSVQLHEALLHCGRFQDALESLLSWLTDTEDLVSNQKPPSAEFKVVKAQIQEQILLQRLLDDRRPTVELIKKEGGKVAELGAESVDKEKVGKEIDCLGQRWDALLKKAENRHKQLKSILVVAQQFHETLEPLSEWLSATEKHLAKAEPIGTQTSKLEEQISQHKELVQSKLDSSQASYVELQERCRRKAEMLQQALANAQLFGEDEVALMNWLNEVHTRLSEVSVKDYKTDVLEKQCAEQLALHEDIELRKQNVDQAISNGLELLKQTTGDEVVVIQGKLDGIKTRYAEINSMSGNVSQTLNQALTLASKLQHTHEDLSSWLENVEAELTAFAAQAPVGEQLVQAQDRQKALLQEARDHKPQVDKLNEVSSSLLELVPWRAREGLDKIVTEDNDRYKATSDTIAHHAEQIDAAILKSQQVETPLTVTVPGDCKQEFINRNRTAHQTCSTKGTSPDQNGFSMDIMRHKDAVDGIVKTGEAIMNSKDEEEKQALKAKIQALLEKYVVVSQLNSERCLQLERAQSLASQFWETYEELWPWLQETRTSFSQLPLASIEYEALRQQQEELRQMRELIAEHKPYIDKMNKTGPQLLELSPVAGVAIREKYTATDLLYAQLKADVKQRAFTLDEAISKSTQVTHFHDKIEPMLESLERIAERLHQPPSISVEVEKIREQITENKVVSADLEKLQPSYDTLKQRGEEMIARSAGADKDISAKAVQDKLDRMVFTWNEIHALMEEREAKLLDVMDLADKFWCDHCALIVTIKDTQDLLRELEEPGVDPSVVKQQQEYLESFKEEIDGLQEELDVVRNLGAELMAACGEPDKPVTKKSIDEVNLAWETLNKAWKERVDRLDEAMQAAVQFQDGLQGMFDWVDIVEHKLGSMSPVGTDLDTVKQQIEELKEFKGEAYQLQMEMERLNHQAGLLLKKVTEEYDRCAIQEPMTELKMLWDNLDEKIINRQHKLEGALLALGQFQHALDELLAWMSNTEELLNEQRKAVGDPKAIEIKLAKHHVLQNDVLAHKTTVEAVNKAGTDLVESTSGEEAAGLQNKLENLTQRWKNILEKTEQRRQQLDSALLQAQGFHGEMEDMQQWLKDTERQLLASKAVGGLPDTAREQLNAHLELCSTMEAKEELYQQLMNKGQQLLTMTPSGQDSNTEQDLRNLQDKWESVQAKVAERKVKLEEALALATEFHNSLQDFISWLTQAEQTLTMSSPASVILETILFQIDEHKVFVTEVNSHRQQIIELDKTGTHLKYFSQKQDVVLIKNLLISVQGRWEKVVQRSVERGRLLDDTRKRAKQFHETWNKLTEWLDDSEKALDSELEIANDPDKIKTQLAQHKEFQKVLGSKHSVYDTTSRTGRALKDKTSLQDDNQKLDDMLSELRDKWDTVCGKSVERQNKLEEALLFSGQFTDALQALIDWLYRVEPQLAEDQPVHGDIDLVLNLIDSHKVFQKELGKRTGSVAALKRSAKDLIESSHEDSSWVKAQMQELSARWETVCARSVSKQTRLEQALCQAEEFHSTVHMLLEWLAEAEQSLRFHGTLPDDEEALGALIEQHKEFMKKQEEKRVGLNKATSMGEAILTICHPDSITTIKHWNTIIKARFEEVQAWARQHQQRLAMALSDLLATKDLLEGLLGWLQWAETTLNDKDKEVIPQEIDEVKSLIAEHQVTFMEEMTRKQPDVDKVTKTHKRKAVVGSCFSPTGKRSPTQAMYPSSQPPIETKNPRVNLLVSKWQQVWLLALDRRRKLNDAMDRLEELKEFANFDFDVWRKRYMRWMNHKKSRVMDFFRRIDKDQDGKVTRQEFIEGILSSKFPTSRLEMSAVADIFDRDGDGYIDYYEFVAALHPNKEAYKPLTDADKIEDEVTRQVAKCKCPKRFQVEQIGANKYRFGDSQQLRLVRILRSTVMVRVGGGWMALDEFLVKNDPCRVHHHGSKMLRSESNSSITQSPIAKGRTNMELREKFILPEGTTQVMASFRYRGRRSRPSSRAASPNRSNSNHSCPAQHNNPALTSTPKVRDTPQHITRNYDKPWLTNSKPSSPLKSSDSFESQGSSSEV